VPSYSAVFVKGLVPVPMLVPVVYTMVKTERGGEIRDGRHLQWCDVTVICLANILYQSLMLVSVFGIHLVRLSLQGYRKPALVLVRVLLVRCHVVWYAVLYTFTCLQVLVVMSTSPGLSISLVVVFGANSSGCWKFELSGAGL